MHISILVPSSAFRCEAQELIRKVLPKDCRIDEVTYITIHLPSPQSIVYCYISLERGRWKAMGLKGTRFIWLRVQTEIIFSELICTYKQKFKNSVESQKKRPKDDDDMQNLHVKWLLRECGWRSFINTARIRISHTLDVTISFFTYLFIHLSFEMGFEYTMFMDGGSR